MNVEHIIFDLDNTLYPSTAAMDEGITKRMIEAVAEFLGVDVERAAELRSKEYRKFSSTLEWLRSEGLTDVERYFAHVHPANEADELPPDPNLRPLLLSIPQDKIILTNAPREHADRVLAKLGVADLFKDVVDIRACGLNGKPYENSYRTALAKIGGTVEDTIFLDDLHKYADGYIAIGGTAILIGDKNGSHLNEMNSTIIKNALGQNTAPQKGRSLKIKSIYFLPDLLNKLKEM